MKIKLIISEQQSRMLKEEMVSQEDRINSVAEWMYGYFNHEKFFNPTYDGKTASNGNSNVNINLDGSEIHIQFRSVEEVPMKDPVAAMTGHLSTIFEKMPGLKFINPPKLQGDGKRAYCSVALENQEDSQSTSNPPARPPAPQSNTDTNGAQSNSKPPARPPMIGTGR